MHLLPACSARQLVPFTSAERRLLFVPVRKLGTNLQPAPAPQRSDGPCCCPARPPHRRARAAGGRGERPCGASPPRGHNPRGGADRLSRPGRVAHLQPATRGSVRQRSRPLVVHRCAAHTQWAESPLRLLVGWASTASSSSCDLLRHAAQRCPRAHLPSGPPFCPPLTAAWALQRIGEHTTDKEHLAAATAGLRTLVVPSNQVGGLADLAWSLSQHPRTRWAVCINAGLDVHGGSAAVADAAAMLSGGKWLRPSLFDGRLLAEWLQMGLRSVARTHLSVCNLPPLSAVPPCAGYDGYSWPANALVIAGFSTAPPSDLAPVFGDRIARVEDRQAA